MQRINALKELAFEPEGLDGYLVFNWANLLYLTGFPGTSAFLIPQAGESTVYVYGVNYEHAKAQKKGFKTDLVKREESLWKKIAAKVIELGIKRLAVDSMSVKDWRSFSKEIRSSVKLTLKGELVTELRKIKDQSEIELMLKAAEFTNIGMKTAYEVLSPGLKEFEMAAEIEHAMRRLGSGGTAFDTAVSSGLSSAFPHGGCTDRKIREGDLVVVDFGAIYKNYRCDMTRTLVAGKSSKKQEQIFQITKKAQVAALEATKAGVSARTVDAAARQIIDKAGYGDLFVHGLGHGVGLEIHEPPILNTTSKDVLTVGNVVTIEPGIYLPGYGGCRIEDTVLVVEEGVEKMTKGFYNLSLK